MQATINAKNEKSAQIALESAQEFFTYSYDWILVAENFNYLMDWDKEKNRPNYQLFTQIFTCRGRGGTFYKVGVTKSLRVFILEKTPVGV